MIPVRGSLSTHSLFTATIVACLLAIGFLGSASATNAASAKRSLLKPGYCVGKNVLESKRRHRDPRIHLPIGPAYIYYDYPYYYARGYYPTHIGGYVYYGFGRTYYPEYGSPLSDWRWKCVVKGSGECRCL